VASLAKGESVLADLNRNGLAICLLDDDPSTVRATSRLLNSAGWEVQGFTDPHLFLQHSQTHQPRVAVIDIWMPLMHGLEVQKKLCQISPATRVIVLTGKDDPGIRFRALNAGALAFFVKPVPKNDLLASIQSAIAAAA
jgi:FixJ family two-component response regulator